MPLIRPGIVAFRFVAAKSATAVGNYYAALAAYHGQASAMPWYGEGAKRLGLEGNVDLDHLRILLANRDPASGERLTSRDKRNRIPAYDLSFHAPKSVSTLALVGNRIEIEAAMRAAVEETMVSVESRAATRVRRGGRSEDRKTENLVWTMCIDRESRPVQGSPDPHLHAHVLVVNATFDQEEARWKAVKPHLIVGAAPIIQAEFQVRLAEKVEALGFKIAWCGHAWEINGVPESVLSEFSRRTRVIDLAAIERGVVAPQLKATLAERTREKKATDVSLDKRRVDWRSRIQASELQVIDAVAASTFEQVPRPPSKIAAGCVKQASESLQRSFAAWGRADLLIETLIAGRGALLESDASSAIAVHGKASGLVEVCSEVFTTRASVQLLSDCIACVKTLAVAQTPLACDFPSPGPQQLSTTQSARADAICASVNRVVMIEGKLGVSRNKTIEAIASRVSASGRKVLRFRRDKHGIFHQVSRDSKTELAGIVMQDDVVVIVEDAEMLGPDCLHDLVKKAGRADARLVFVAQPRRKMEVDRGDGLRLLASQAQIPSFALSSATGRTGGGQRHEIADVALSRDGAVRDAVVARVDSLAKAGKRFVVVTDDGQVQLMLTQLIRAKLRSTGCLGPSDGPEGLPCAGDRVVFNGQPRSDTDFIPGLITDVQDCDGKTVFLDGGASYPINDPDFGFAWVVSSEMAKGMRVDEAIVVGEIPDLGLLRRVAKNVTRFSHHAPSSAVHAQTDAGALGQQWARLCDQLAVAGRGAAGPEGARSYKSVSSDRSAIASSTPDQVVPVTASATYKSPGQFPRQPQHKQLQLPQNESPRPTPNHPLSR